MKNLNWNLLRIFSAIVEHRSISKAAICLHRTQPAVSNALKQLEAQIGHTLVHRGGTRFEVTEEGQLLYRECRQIVSRLERISELIQDYGEVVSGTIRVCVSSGMVSSFLEEYLRDFRNTYPNAYLDFSVECSAKIQESVFQGEYPVGMCLRFNDYEQLEYVTLTKEHFGFFCGQGHRLFDAKTVTLEDMANEDFVSFQTDQFGDALWPITQFRIKKGLKGRIIGTSPYLEEVRRMALAGIGIATCPVHAMAGDVELGILRQLPPYERLPVITNYLVTNPRLRKTRIEELFIKGLKLAIAKTPVRQRTYPLT